MKYLVDTNIFIFSLNDPGSLSPSQRRILLDPASQLFMSRASLHEMAVKVRKGNLEFLVPFEQVVDKERRRLGVRILPEKTFHYKALSVLEKIPGHGDPFDLLILSQAKAEKMPVLTSDTEFPKYAGVTAIL